MVNHLSNVHLKIPIADKIRHLYKGLPDFRRQFRRNHLARPFQIFISLRLGYFYTIGFADNGQRLLNHLTAHFRVSNNSCQLLRIRADI